MHPTYQLVEDNQITGPHSIAVLRQKAEIHVIRPDTPVRAVVEPPEPWKPIRAWPELHDLLFVAKTPPPLGTARFHSTNAETDANSTPVNVPELLRANLAAEQRFPVVKGGPSALRCLGFATAVALWVLPLLLFYFNFLPRTGNGALILAGVGIAGVTVIYWIMFHLLDSR